MGGSFGGVTSSFWGSICSSLSFGRKVIVGEMSVFGAMVTRSTGTTGADSARSSRCACRSVTSVPAMIPACKSTETIRPAPREELSSTVAPILRPTPLLPVGFRPGDIRNEPDMGEAGGAQQPHYLHHPPVIDRAVAAHEYPLVIAIRCDCRQPRHQIVLRHDRVLKVDRAVIPNGDRQRLAILAQGLSARLGKIDRYADRQERRRDHEHDQKHQHHVDERRDVDLRHDAATAPAAMTARLYDRSHQWAF